MNQSPPWSHSMLECFANCPRQAYHRYILKEKGPTSPALQYGNAVHKALENRIKGEKLPEKFQKFNPLAESVINCYSLGMQVHTELKMGIKRDFISTDFFAKDVWGRGAADIVLIKNPIAIIFDWKTGKKRDKIDQMRILALMIFAKFPEVNHVTSCNLWLESGDIGSLYKFDRSHVPAMWREVLPKIMAMEKALASNQWPETPSPLCGYCSVTSCKYNKS